MEMYFFNRSAMCVTLRFRNQPVDFHDISAHLVRNIQRSDNCFYVCKIPVYMVVTMCMIMMMVMAVPMLMVVVMAVAVLMLMVVIMAVAVPVLMVVVMAVPVLMRMLVGMTGCTD